MIRQLHLNSFKVFDELTLNMTKLNILTGCNNSGKSSILQAIRLLDKQKPLEGLGSLNDFIRGNNSGFDISCEDVKGRYVKFSSMRDGKPISNEKRVKSLISYISADRYGPRSTLDFGIYGEVDTVGAFGEKIIDFLYQLDTSFMELKVPEPLRINGGAGVRNNLQEWLRLVSPGVGFDFKTERGANIGWLEFDQHKSIHVGFGLSYVLPLILSVLVHASQMARKDDSQQILLLVENPEAHLHPAGQTMMGRLLALGAACGVQILVETHSDHLLNGIRIAVKDKKLEAKDSVIFFFKTIQPDGIVDSVPYAVVEELHADEYGMINNWPEGFFDETEKNLLKLI